MRILYYFFIIILIFYSYPILVNAEAASYIVISEIKLTGGSGYSTDEFVELYNPAETNVLLSGWQLIKKTASGNEYVLVDDFGELEVKAHSFILIAHPAGYLGEVQPDIYYTTTNSISSNNSVILLDHASNEIDKVGMGTASVFESEAAVNPGSNKSVERKAHPDSTEDTMVEGGPHYFLGNGEDSDNNAQDFVSRSQPEPQNSMSEQEYLDIEVPVIPNPPAEEPDTPPADPKTDDGPSPEPVVYSDKIIITELFPNPEGVDNYEFIELFNGANEDVDLESWKLGDNSTRKYTIKKDDFSSTVIKANSYFIISKEASGISLNNTSDTAKLFHPDETLVDSIEYDNCQEAQSYSLVDIEWIWTDEPTPGAENTFVVKNELPTASFELEDGEGKVGQVIIFDATDSNDADGDKLEFLWDFGDGEQAKGEKVEHTYREQGNYTIVLLVRDDKGGEDEMEASITVLDYDYSEKVLISELLPACSGSDQECEYIELYSFEDRDVKLEGWQLTDQKSRYRFSEDDFIESEGYLLIERKDSKITLNNSGEKVFLIDPAGKIINGVEFGKAKKDFAFARDLDSQKWQWTEKPTPGEKNEFILEEKESDSSASSGSDEKVETSSINTDPLEIGIAEVNEDYLGRLLKIRGELESKKSVSYYLMDELGNVLRMYIQKKTNIPKLNIEVGDMMEVVGILDKTSAGLRLLPRTQEDIIIIPKNVEKQAEEGKVLGASAEKEIIDVPISDKSKQVKMYLYIGVGALVAVLIGIGIRLYIQKRGKASEIE